ncbi:MAG: hypothetical protein H7A46_03625 [Verrucomicrobiales bacterium]|nr:hypothetical protein [Verrucomicrobiales bacterium]
MLQLEAVAQVAGILMMKRAENLNKLAYFMAADTVKWRKPVRPGDTLVVDVEITKARGKIARAQGHVPGGRRGGQRGRGHLHADRPLT